MRFPGSYSVEKFHCQKKTKLKAQHNDVGFDDIQTCHIREMTIAFISKSHYGPSLVYEPPPPTFTQLPSSIQDPISDWLCHEWYLMTYLSSRLTFWSTSMKCLFWIISTKAVIFLCMFWRVELGSWKSPSKVWFRVAAFSMSSTGKKRNQLFNQCLKSG